MDAETFSPPRRVGVLVQGVGMIALGVGGFWLLNLAALVPGGPALAVDLFGGLALLGGAAWLFYGFYALQRSAYAVHRDGLHLRWGWRTVQIPMTEVLAAYRADRLEQPPPLPFPRWPGWVVGRRRAPWGPVEYLASDPRRLVFIETGQGWYAISPEDPAAFLDALRRAAEEGSLNPLPAYSQHPLDLLGDLREDRWAQGLLLGAWLAGVLLLFLVLVLPLPTSGDGLWPRWLLLPVVNFLFLGTGLGMGMFAYRNPRRQGMAYPLWLSNLVASLSLLGWVIYAGLFR